jgi:hypothetical protein
VLLLVSCVAKATPIESPQEGFEVFRQIAALERDGSLQGHLERRVLSLPEPKRQRMLRLALLHDDVDVNLGALLIMRKVEQRRVIRGITVGLPTSAGRPSRKYDPRVEVATPFSALKAEVLPFLRHDSVAVRREASLLIAVFGKRPEAPLMLPLVEDSDIVVRNQAFLFLRHHGDANVVMSLARRLRGLDATTPRHFRKCCLDALHNLTGRDWDVKRWIAWLDEAETMDLDEVLEWNEDEMRYNAMDLHMH